MSKGFRLIKRYIFDQLEVRDTDGTITFRANPDNVTINTLFRVGAVVSPAQITSNQNDYNPTGLVTANVLRLSTDASRDITGIVTTNQIGRVLFIHNVGSFNIVLKNASASSTAEYRFSVGADLTLQPDRSVLLHYDSTSLRWRAISV